MSRKTSVITVAATNAAKKRNRAGFHFDGSPRAVKVTLDRKLAIQADPDLKIYRLGSDQEKRATGKEEYPNSMQKMLKKGQQKLHDTVESKPDYQRSRDSIMNELEMIGEEGVQDVAADLGIKPKKGEDLTQLVGAKILTIDEGAKQDLEDGEPEEEEENDEEEGEEENGEEDEKKEEETETLEATEENVQKRAKELNELTIEERHALLEKHGYEVEGDKFGQIVAILTEEFGDAVESMELPDITEDEEEGEDGDGEGTQDDEEAAQDAPKGKKAVAPPAKAKTAPKAKEKPAAKKKVKDVKKKK